MAVAAFPNALEAIGRTSVRFVDELGYVVALLVESIYWLLIGRRRNQPVSLREIFHQSMEVGVSALPIGMTLALGVGLMLGIQGIHTLRTFGAESQVVTGIAWSVTREFSALIVGILVAGRSGSALAARIGTMVVNQEIDALRVIGINPVRHLVAPTLVALVVTVPALVILSMGVSLLGGAIYTGIELQMSPLLYFEETFRILAVSDVMQGMSKAVLFAIIITLVGAANGFSATGGAEGVGRATTRSVVVSITGIISTDMVFAFFVTRMTG
ncbi:MAG: MlaE family ABC transporter permease [Gammaproteobacteria bacterium]